MQLKAIVSGEGEITHKAVASLAKSTYRVLRHAKRPHRAYPVHSPDKAERNCARASRRLALERDEEAWGLGHCRLELATVRRRLVDLAGK